MSDLAERVVARQALAQLLAEAGINKETIHTMLNDLINEKAEKALRDIRNGSYLLNNLSDRIKREADSLVKQELERAIRRAVSEQLAGFKVQVSITQVAPPKAEEKWDGDEDK